MLEELICGGNGVDQSGFSLNLREFFLQIGG
jgi:hypothetical protein